MSPEALKLALAFVVFAVVVYVYFVRGGASVISSQEARRLVKDGARLVDVRSPGEFAGGHLHGAINIPVQEIGQRAAELAPNDKPVVLYCRSGARSASAARALSRAGFSSVHNLGGMSRW